MQHSAIHIYLNNFNQTNKHNINITHNKTTFNTTHFNITHISNIKNLMDNINKQMHNTVIQPNHKINHIYIYTHNEQQTTRTTTHTHYTHIQHKHRQNNEHTEHETTQNTTIQNIKKYK